MYISSVQTAELDRLDRQLVSAHAVSAALFQKVMESAGERLSILRRAGKIAHIERLLEEAACTDAALALADIEMPNWKIRRLVFENDEWRCSLSRQPSVLIEFDAMAEANHAVLSLAILRALIEARRINRAEPISAPADVSLGSSTLFCCDNFA